jgi:crossover junction endodeoxyribonuclease RuvC
LMVRRILPGFVNGAADAADALAVAICHAHYGATRRAWAISAGDCQACRHPRPNHLRGRCY